MNLSSLNKITAKQFTFIGLAMLGVSIIILTVWFSLGLSRELYLKHESCLQKYSELIFNADYKTEVKDDFMLNSTITSVCAKEAPDPATGQFAQITYIVLFTASMLLVFGAIVSLSGAVAMLKIKIKNRMRRRKNKN
jgi:hypothetical protein